MNADILLTSINGFRLEFKLTAYECPAVGISVLGWWPLASRPLEVVHLADQSEADFPRDLTWQRDEDGGYTLAPPLAWSSLPKTQP